MDKHSSLLRNLVNYECKMFYNIDPWIDLFEYIYSPFPKVLKLVIFTTTQCSGNFLIVKNLTLLWFPSIGLYHPLDGITSLMYKLLCFLTPNKKFKEKGTSF
jgi:hypothetical protein